jgi:hypothetical protein
MIECVQLLLLLQGCTNSHPAAERAPVLSVRIGRQWASQHGVAAFAAVDGQ